MFDANDPKTPYWFNVKTPTVNIGGEALAVDRTNTIVIVAGVVVALFFLTSMVKK